MSFVYYGVGALALALVSLGKLRLWRGLLIVAAALMASSLTPPPHGSEIVYLDVGQGDSTLIRLPNRVEILVDAGGTPFSDFDIGENTVVPALRALDDDELELVIASHADTDHIEGLASVLREVLVQRLVIGYPSKESEAFEAYMAIAEQRRIPVTEVRRGEVLHIGEAKLEFLHATMQPLAETNENSVAFLLAALGTDVII